METTLVSQMVTELSKKIKEKKEQIIKDRLIESGLFHLFPTKKTRFSKILCESDENGESWYIDNGTDEGFRIVTFVSDNTLNNKDYSHNKIDIKLNYY